MEKNNYWQEGEDRVTEGLISWDLDGIFDHHSLFADEDDHESKGVNGNHDRNESAVHETNEQKEKNLGSLRGVIKLNRRNLLIGLLLNHRVLCVLSLAHTTHLPLVEAALD